MKTTYIVSAHRTAVGKAPRGLFRFKRPDELAAETIEHMMSTLPDFDVTIIDDVLIGRAASNQSYIIFGAEGWSECNISVSDLNGKKESNSMNIALLF